MKTKRATVNSISKEKIKKESHLKQTLFAYFLLASFLIISGSILIFTSDLTVIKMNLALVLSASIIVLLYLFWISTANIHKIYKELILSFLILTNLVLVIQIPNLLSKLLIIILGCLSLVLALFFFLNIYRDLTNGLSPIQTIIITIFYSLIACLILFNDNNFRILSIFIGVYFLIYGLSILYEVIRKRRHKPYAKNITIGLPTFVAAFLPTILYKKLNTKIKGNPKSILALQNEDEKRTDLTIYIQMKAGMIPGMGHCSFSFNNKLYSYGDYDQETRKLFGYFSDGVLSITSPEIYLNSELKNNKKMIMAYSLKLTDKQKDNIQKKIDEIMSKTYPWKSKAELFFEESQFKGTKIDDTASCFYLQENAKLYKFKKGSPYKTYCGVTENCATFVNDIIKLTGIRPLKFNHVVSPGSYLQYLDQLYNMENSIISGRKLYSLNVKGEPLEYPKTSGGLFKEKGKEIEIV